MAVHIPAFATRGNVFCAGAALGINRHHNALRAVTLRRIAYHLRVGNGGRVEAGFVCAGIEQTAHVLHGAHAAAHGQGDEYLRGHILDDVQDQIAVVAAGGDVEKREFVCALIVIACGNFNRVACVAQLNKIDALDHAAVGDVETGNDAFG